MSGSVSMASCTPAQSPAAKTAGTLVCITSESWGTQPLRGERAIAGEEGEGPVCAHRAGPLPVAEAHEHVAGAGGDDQAVIADEPGAAVVGEAKHGPLKLAHRRSVDEGAPDRGGELD